jgi:uncharacterized protein YcaQ
VRRFLLEAQDLLSDHHYDLAVVATPARVRSEIRRLEAVQLDPVAAVARNQHLVLAARIPGYTPALVERLLAQGRIFEYWGHAACMFPIEDYPIFEGQRRARRKRLAPELAALRPVVKAVLTRLEREGPLPSRAFLGAARVRGYWDNTGPKTKATSHALNLLTAAGLVMVARREGLERYFDLPERVVPPEVLRRAREVDPRDADEALLAKYLRAHRVFDVGDGAFGWRKMPVPRRRAIVARMVRAGLVIPLELEGVRRPYFILADDEDRLRRHDRAAAQAGDRNVVGPVRFLPPLDNLLWRRERLADLFGFVYTWEVYIPPPRRRYGYYTMPILAGDRLVGRMDPRLDRGAGRLIVNLLHVERGVAVTAPLRTAVREALERFARLHGVSGFTVEASRPARLLR